MTTYPYQNLTPQSPMSLKEHHRVINLLAILIIVAIIIGIIYWWTTPSQRHITPTQLDARAQIAALLSNSKVTVSQEQINTVAAQLSASKTFVTDAEKAAVAAQLRAK